MPTYLLLTNVAFVLTIRSGVEPISLRTRDQIATYVRDYGETLTVLPGEAWNISEAQWMVGYWDCLVDLWTEESGASDLVLFVRVTELESGAYRFAVTSVHVP